MSRDNAKAAWTPMETNQKLTVAEYDKLVKNTDDAMLKDKGK